MILMNYFPKQYSQTSPREASPPLGRPLVAYILSAYFYPHSKSLGNNSLALVMSMNLGRNVQNYVDLQQNGDIETTEIVVMARNKTTGIKAFTNYERITPHEDCQMIAVFASVQLLPNPTMISMLSTDQLTSVPFKIPSTKKRSVVMCISPIYVSEQWQNFLLAAHIYKQFGAYLHIYVISAITSFFELMQEYEKSGYLTIQPWDRIIFPFVPGSIADAYSQVEFQNLAAAQTDCLLQYKETADFVSLLELNDILIPKAEPTYIKEFQALVNGYKGPSKIAYLEFDRQHYIATVYNNTKFSITDMVLSLQATQKKSKGKIVLIPSNVNYTHIDRPSFLSNGYVFLKVKNHSLIHLERINWSNDGPKSNSMNISVRHKPLSKMESSLRAMSRKEKIAEIIPNLPDFYYFYDLVSQCFEERYYKVMRSKSWKSEANICPGPQICGFYQHPDLKCVHVNAAHLYMPQLEPITYYYATDHYFSADIGCYPQ